jgi:2-polyprenyl-3-methyl-5-hydroxy-6-metoxy-1,4-benzoquinol methylase
MFNNTAHFYDTRWKDQAARQRPINRKRIERVTSAALHKLPKHARPSLIDVGCGNGWILEVFSTKLGDRCRLYGVEPSPIGAQNAASKVPTATIICGTLADLKNGERFDVVVCSEVIEHVEDQNAFIDAISLVTKPGGWLVLTTPNGAYREDYFRVTGSMPQPVENWVSPVDLMTNVSRNFVIETYSTFDLSFWLLLHPTMRRIGNVLRKIPGGQRIIQSLERLFSDHRGLYQFVIARSNQF